jgi:hypothetical protein
VLYIRDPPQEPTLLKSLAKERVRDFLETLAKYQASGGAKTATAFLGAGILQYIQYVAFDTPPTEIQILDFLRQKAEPIPSDVTLIVERLSKIKIDEEEKSSEDKVQSLLISFEEALSEMRLSDRFIPGAVACIPVETHIELVMEKIPPGLQRKVKTRMKCLPKLESKRQFAILLIEEAKNFTWPKSVIRRK